MGRNLLFKQRAHHLPCSALHEGWFNLTTSAAVDQVQVDGVESIARTAAGLYTITLSRPAMAINGFRANHQPAPAAAARFVEPATLAAATRVAEAKLATLKIRSRVETGANTELATGDVIWISFTAEYSTADARIT